MQTTTLPKPSLIIARKVYRTSFVLDKPKLSRIVNVLGDRLQNVKIAYSIKLQNGKTLKLNSIEEVFEQDNRVKNPIVSLNFGTTGTKAFPNSVNLYFDGERTSTIDLKVIGVNSTEANQIFAEVEEQVERTFQSNWANRIRKNYGQFWPVAFALIGLFVATYFLIYAMDSFPRGTSMSKEQTAILAERAKEAQTTEQKLDIIFEVERNRLVAASSAIDRVPLADRFTRRWLFIGLPLLLVISIFAFMCWKLYPSAVFDWGDFEEHYRKILTRRRNLWTIVVVGLFINILAAIFMMGVLM